MNTSLLSKEYDQIKGIVHIVPYQINRSGLYPFLQYFLLKYSTNLEEQEDSLDFENETKEETDKIEQKKREDYISFLKLISSTSSGLTLPILVSLTTEDNVQKRADGLAVPPLTPAP